jgi:hypothetical protein
MSFDLDNAKPCLPNYVAFQVMVTFMNFNIHQCTMEEGDSSWVISLAFWMKMGSPNLSLSQINLRAFNGKSFQTLGVLTNLHITLRFKIVLISGRICGWSFGLKHPTWEELYIFHQDIASSIFYTMQFPYAKKSGCHNYSRNSLVLLYKYLMWLHMLFLKSLLTVRKNLQHQAMRIFM